MLFYAAQGVSCAARVRKPLTSGTSSKPKVLNSTARTASQESCVFDTKNCFGWLFSPTARGAAPPASRLDASAQEQSTSAPHRAGSKNSGFQAKFQGSGCQAAVQQSQSGPARTNYSTGAYRVSLEVGSALQEVQATATCSMSFNRNLLLFFSVLK